MQVLQIARAVILNPGISTTVVHGLQTAYGRPLIPNYIMPDRITSIGVTAHDATSVTFTNLGASPSAANFEIKIDHTIQRELSDPTELIWQGGAIAAEPIAYGQIYVEQGVTNQVTNVAPGTFEVVVYPGMSVRLRAI